MAFITREQLASVFAVKGEKPATKLTLYTADGESVTGTVKAVTPETGNDARFRLFTGNNVKVTSKAGAEDGSWQETRSQTIGGKGFAPLLATALEIATGDNRTGSNGKHRRETVTA